MSTEDNVNFDPDTGEVFGSKSAGGGQQLALFEGHKIHVIEQKLKAAGLGIGSPDTKLYETKYFVVKAKAMAIEHADKDGLLIKTVKYESEKAAEIDEFSGERFIVGI
ncbi:MAG: hypothetical protein ACYC1U_06770 [Candidatus Aquicultorales bacterium]